MGKLAVVISQAPNGAFKIGQAKKEGDEQKMKMKNDLYDLLLRKQAKLVMQIEVLDHFPNIEARKEAIEQKNIIKRKRLHMKAQMKESV